MGTSSTRVACVQLAPEIADPKANRRLATRAIRDAADSGGQVIVLPELATTGYHLEPSEAVRLAEDPTGPSVSAWIQALHGTRAIVVGGFCERGPDGRIYNSAAMVSADGLLSVYRKTHLWDQEHLLFSAGDQPPPVVDTDWGPVAVAICYDLFFPELTRAIALAGARLLAVPTNSPYPGSRAAGSLAPSDGIGHAVARSAAYLNRMFVAVCDRHGDERGNAWMSRSSVIGPEGEFLAGPVGYAEELLVADCALADAERKRWDGTTSDAFADRRPELYSGVAAPLTTPSVLP